MTADQYLIIAPMFNCQDVVDRPEAETFLAQFFNAQAIPTALDGVKNCNDVIRLSEGYIIRRAESYHRTYHGMKGSNQ